MGVRLLEFGFDNDEQFITEPRKLSRDVTPRCCSLGGTAGNENRFRSDTECEPHEELLARVLDGVCVVGGLTRCHERDETVWSLLEANYELPGEWFMSFSRRSLQSGIPAPWSYSRALMDACRLTITEL